MAYQDGDHGLTVPWRWLSGYVGWQQRRIVVGPPRRPLNDEYCLMNHIESQHGKFLMQWAKTVRMPWLKLLMGILSTAEIDNSPCDMPR